MNVGGLSEATTVADLGTNLANIPVIGDVSNITGEVLNPDTPTAGTAAYFGSDYTFIKNFQQKLTFRNPLNTRNKFVVYELQAKADGVMLPQDLMGQYYVQQNYDDAYKTNVNAVNTQTQTDPGYVASSLVMPQKWDIQVDTGDPAMPTIDVPGMNTTIYDYAGFDYHRVKAMAKVNKHWKTVNKINCNLEPLATFEYVTSLANFKWFLSKEYELRLGKYMMSSDGLNYDTLQGTSIIGGVTKVFMCCLQGPEVFGDGNSGTQEWAGTVPLTSVGSARVDIFSETCWAIQDSIKTQKQHVVKQRIIDNDTTPVTTENYPRTLPGNRQYTGGIDSNLVGASLAAQLVTPAP